VVSEIGRGSQTIVYLAMRGSARYAVKLLSPSLLDDSEALTAFRREAALLASVYHPGLARVHEVGEVDGQPYLVMDFVEGQPLSRRLAGGPLPVERAVAVASDVAATLAAVHCKGLVHRDVKPSNIVVLPAGRAVLIDFGLAGRASACAGASLVGTAAYLAPEQSGMLKRPVDNRSDLYSLGVVIFESVAGRRPFESRDMAELLRMHATVPAPDLREVAAEVEVDVTEDLAGVVARLLAKDPDDRYQDGEALLADLDRSGTRPRPASVPQGPGVASQGPGTAAEEAVVPFVASARATRLVGRDSEVARLAGCWARAVAGSGRACVVRGAPGSGKSLLVAALADQAAREGHIVLYGKATPDVAAPLALLRSAVEGYLAACAVLPEAQRARRHEQLRAAAGPAAPLLAALWPVLTGVLSTVPPEGDLQDQFPVAVVELLSRLAVSSTGLLLCLDDLQWVDAGTPRVLGLLSEGLAEVPLMVLCTARDDPGSVAVVESAVAAMGPAVIDDFALGPLDGAGVSALVQSELPGVRGGSALSRVLVARGNGNPFVTVQYLRAVVDAGLLRPCWGEWVLDEEGLGALALPDDVLGLVLARVDGLGAGPRQVLTAAAALGVDFDSNVVAMVSGGDGAPTLDALARASRHRLLVPRDGGRYTFVHDRAREALLGQLDDRERRALHQHIAEVLDEHATALGGRLDDEAVYAMARHYLSGEPARAPGRTFAACTEAGRRALGAQSPGRAAELLGHAAGTGQPLDAAFLLLYGTALQRSGQLAEAEQRLEDALALETGTLSRAQILVRLAEVHRAGWSAEAARRAVERGLAELGAPLPRNPLALVVTSVASFLVGLFIGWTGKGSGRLAGERYERARLIAALHDIGRYIGTVGLRPDVLFVHNLRSLYWVNRLGRGRQFAASTIALGFLAGFSGLWPVAERCFSRGERAAAELGNDPELVALSQYYRGITAYLGRRDDGELLARALVDHGRWLETGLYADGVAVLASDAANRGTTAEALDWLRRGDQRVPATGSDQVTALLPVGALGEAATGRAAGATEILRRARSLAARKGGKGLQVNVCSCTAHALVEEGEVGARFDEVAQELAAFRLQRATTIRPHRWAAADLAMGRLAQARAAPAEARPGRLRQARAALRVLGKVANTPALRAYLEIARGDMDVLEGRPRRALDRMGRLNWSWPDAPAVSYGAAMARARALVALGQGPEAARQVRYALAIAEEQGWPHRARMVRAELGELTSVGSSSVMPSSFVPAGQQERQRLQALEEVSTAVARVLDPDTVVRVTLDRTIRILNADRAFLFLTGVTAVGSRERTGEEGGAPEGGDDDRLTPHLGRDSSGADLTDLARYSASLVERVRLSREPVVVTGSEEGEALGAHSAVVHGLRSIMVAPLQLDERLLGVVYLDSQVAKGMFTAEDAGILTALTSYIAMALETARAAQLEVSARAEQRRRQLAETLRAAEAVISGTLGPDTVLTRLLDQAAVVLACGAAWLVRAHGDHVTAQAPVAATEQEDERPAPLDVPCDEAFRALLVSDSPQLYRGPLPAPLLGACGQQRPWVVVPLLGGGNGRLGLLLLRPEGSDGDLEGQMEIAATLVAQALTAHDRAVLFCRLTTLSVVDELTGIANRRGYLEAAERHLQSCRRDGRSFSAVMIDIDNFKRVNDEHGHHSGDDVICAVAERVTSEIRSTDLLGRYGGDELALVLVDLDAEAALRTAERLRAAVADAPVRARAGLVHVTISLGVAQLAPDDTALVDVLARADEAMYRAKQDGRNLVRAR
jgi:diguanylate cyclase (GGDEF)-like protein